MGYPNNLLKFASEIAAPNVVRLNVGLPCVGMVRVLTSPFSSAIFIVSQQTSIMRAASRFAQEGRYLSLDYLTERATVPSRYFSKFAKQTLGDYLYERTEEEVQNIRGRLRRLRGELYGSGSGLRQLPASQRGREESYEGAVQVSLGRRELFAGGSDISLLLNPLFSYAEWKSNDVAFGEKPKIAKERQELYK